MNVKDMTDEQLKDEYLNIHQQITYMPHGTRDLLWRDAMSDELNSRGFNIVDEPTIFREVDEDEPDDNFR